MKKIFISKILIKNCPTLILTDFVKYAPISQFSSFDELMELRREELQGVVNKLSLTESFSSESTFEPLLESQLVYGTGATYLWSEEKLNTLSPEDPYKKVYLAERPMLFVKGMKSTLAQTNDFLNLRQDCDLNIPEGEMVAVFNKHGETIGFTLGNDQTALTFEKINPLYQSQAKFFQRSGSLLPLILLSEKLPETTVSTRLLRGDSTLVEIEYSTAHFVKNLESIIRTLIEMKIFNKGGFVFLGCGVSYPKNCPPKEGDIVLISSDLFPVPLKNTYKLL